MKNVARYGMLLALLGLMTGAPLLVGATRAEAAGEAHESDGTSAAYHRRLAEKARAKSDAHEAMAQEIQAKGINPKVDWRGHCAALAASYRQVAEQHEAMARDLEQ